MGVRNKKTRIALAAAVLLVVGYAGYQGVLAVRAGQHLGAAERALARRDFRQAGRHLQEYLDLRPGDLSARLLAARTARRRGEFDEALHHLVLYGQRDGPPEPAVLERRLLRAQRGDVAEAERLLCSDDEFSPSEKSLIQEAAIEGLLNTRLPLYAQIVPDQAVPEPSAAARLREVIERWMGENGGEAARAQGLVWRGRVSRLVRDHASATADFRRALELDPLNFQARLLLAMEVVLHSPRETVDHLRALCRQEPDNLRVRHMLAVVLRNLGEPDGARRVLDEALAFAPDSASLLLERGNVALEEEDHKQAELFFRRALELAPSRPEPNFALSRCLRLQGKAEEAKHFRKQFELLEAERAR